MSTAIYTFEQLKEDVRKEAEALKIHATKEERERLKYSILNPSHTNHCIYGQMTGNCYSKRAASLIHTCCVRYFTHNVVPYSYQHRATIGQIQEHVNGTTVDNFEQDRCDIFSSSHFSAIEAYICLAEARNENLIAFLRGETETLTL